MININALDPTALRAAGQRYRYAYFPLPAGERMRAEPRLIIVCGLPGSGKTTRAKLLADRLGAIRFAPDEWMNALEIDLYDEANRDRIEALQWKLGQDLLRLGLTVIIEWGTWSRAERDELRLGARARRRSRTALPLSITRSSLQPNPTPADGRPAH